VNTANTRVFKVAVPGARMKLVGGDSGRYEREEWIDDVVIAPSERAIVDVRFDAAGAIIVQHLTPGHAYPLVRFDAAGAITVQHLTPGHAYPLVHVDVVDAGDGASRADDFDVLRVDHDVLAERERIARYLDVPPDKTLALVAEMDSEEPDDGGPVVYVCPMHPEIVRDAPGKCPKCGMKLMASHADADSGAGSVPPSP